MTDPLLTAIRLADQALGRAPRSDGADRSVRDAPLPVDGPTLAALEAAAEALMEADTAADPRWEFRTAADRWEFRDNYRAARADDPAQVADYARRRATGCCGSLDLLIDGWLFGFNHGH